MPPRAVLYSKSDCHLCDLAQEILERLAREGEVSWTRVDIWTDAALLDRYRYEIPVIELADGTLLRWPTTLEQVRRALRAVRAAT